MSCPSLFSTEGQRQPSPLFPRRDTSSMLGNGRKRYLVPNMERGMVIHRHETPCARKSFYICPPDELGEEVPSPRSFLIRTASACPHQAIVVVPLLSCDSLVMVTRAEVPSSVQCPALCSGAAALQAHSKSSICWDDVPELLKNFLNMN